MLSSHERGWPLTWARSRSEEQHRLRCRAKREAVNARCRLAQHRFRNLQGPLAADRGILTSWPPALTGTASWASTPRRQRRQQALPLSRKPSDETLSEGHGSPVSGFTASGGFWPYSCYFLKRA